MSIATDLGIARARRSLTRIPRRLADADAAPICLACGKPAFGRRVIRHHGDVFHRRCAVYRGRHTT